MYYFAYGSNMSQSQMKNRCPDSKLFGKGFLKNYKLDFLEFSPRWNGGCADVIPEDNSEVWGLIYEVSKNDIILLDGFEGHPNFYIRKTLPIYLENTEAEKSTTIEAEVYILVNKKPFIVPSEEYLGIIKSAAKQFNFPKEYRDYINQVRLN